MDVFSRHWQNASGTRRLASGTWRVSTQDGRLSLHQRPWQVGWPPGRPRRVSLSVSHRLNVSERKTVTLCSVILAGGAGPTAFSHSSHIGLTHVGLRLAALRPGLISSLFAKRPSLARKRIISLAGKPHSATFLSLRRCVSARNLSLSAALRES